MNATARNTPDASCGLAGFADYLARSQLPANRSEVHRDAASGLTLAMVQHAPSRGIEYAPVNELIVSVVMSSRGEPVVRDVGYGEQTFTDLPGRALLTPPGSASYWRFDSSPQVLHLSLSVSQMPWWLAGPTESASDPWAQAARRWHDDPVVAGLALRLWQGRQQLGSSAWLQHGIQTLLGLLLGRGLTESSEPSAAPGSTLVPVSMPVSMPRPMPTPTPTPMATAMPTPIPTAAAAPAHWDRIWQRIEQQPATVTVGELAVLADCSVDHFSRQFKRLTGRSPHRYLSEARIRLAQQRLLQSSVAITDLAVELGFSSSAHFASRFKQLVGVAPSVWRAKSGAMSWPCHVAPLASGPA